MEFRCVVGDIVTLKVEAVVLPVMAGVKEPQGQTGAVDKALDGLIANELDYLAGYNGDLGQTWIIHTHRKIGPRYIVLLGLGQPECLDAAGLRRAYASAYKACNTLNVRKINLVLPGTEDNVSLPALTMARCMAEGFRLGSYRFLKHKSSELPVLTTPEDIAADKYELQVIETTEERVSTIQQGLTEGRLVAETVNWARDLVADGANHVNPDTMKGAAEALIQGYGDRLSLNVLDKHQIWERGMGAFSFVAQGSAAPAYLLHLSYKPEGEPKKRIALVGKGITFDSGGLSLKTSQGMELMKMDMAGAAAVLATMNGLMAMTRAGVPLDIQVDAFIPTCENMPGPYAGRPGDIVTTLIGKTVEINNTDAEGRLILCDALTYAQQVLKDGDKPIDAIVDLATLTGACITALGRAAAGIMSTSESLTDEIRQAGALAGEKYWPLPLYDEYKENLKSDVANLINANSKGEAGTSYGGMFLKEFITPGQAWAHLDIAGPAWLTKDLPEMPKGATGFGTRTLLYWLLDLK